MPKSGVLIMKKVLKSENLKTGLVLLPVLAYFASWVFFSVPGGVCQNILLMLSVVDVTVFLFCVMLRQFDPKKKVSIFFELLMIVNFSELMVFIITDGYRPLGEWSFGVAAVFKNVKILFLLLFYKDYYRKRIINIWPILLICVTYDALCKFVPQFALPALGIMALLTLGIYVKICKERKKRSRLFGLSHLLFMFGSVCGVTVADGNIGENAVLCSFLSTALACFLWYCLYLKVIVKVRNDEVKTAKQNLDFKSEEMSVMLSQIKPHFIYNTLNTIQYLCRTDGELAADTIADFSDYLRTNLNFDSNRQVVPFEEELEHINKYLKIEKLRFRHRLMVKYDIQETGFYVPTLSLQPIIENAVKHGISKRLNGGTIIISTFTDDENYIIQIKDNGVGFTEKEVEEKEKNTKRKSLGMKNIKNRIENLLDGRLEIESRKERGTTARIYLPIEKNLEGGKNENSLY